MRRLRSASAGKPSGRRTEIAYKADWERTNLLNKMKSNVTRTPGGRCGGYVRGRLLFLPGEVSQADRADAKQEPAVVTTNCEKSAEVIVAERGRTEQS